jgi:UDP-glucose 4-epimerase
MQNSDCTEVKRQKRILVTGGAGLIGKPLSDYLASSGHEVHVIDDLSNSTSDVISPHWTSFHQFDLTDNKKTVETIVNIKPDIIYHLACHPYEGLSQFCPYDVCNTTHIATVNVVSGAIKAKTVTRFVNYSSMARYGSGHKMDNGEIRGPPFDETYRPNPEDVYACAKVSAERIVEILCDLHGIEWVHCVPHNVYGEANTNVLSDPYRGVILIWINCLLRGKNFWIYGDGEQTRAPSYVGDCVEPMAKLGLADKELVASQAFNIGALKEYSLNEIAKVMIEVYEEVTGKRAPPPKYTEARPLEVKHAYCNNNKSVKVLGYQDNTSLKEGIRRMLVWALKVAPNGVEPRYLTELEIDEKAPIQWKKRLF